MRLVTKQQQQHKPITSSKQTKAICYRLGADFIRFFPSSEHSTFVQRMCRTKEDMRTPVFHLSSVCDWIAAYFIVHVLMHYVTYRHSKLLFTEGTECSRGTPEITTFRMFSKIFS